jgi:excisionase family DNA binding protein
MTTQKGATKPPLILEPAYSYQECADALGVSLALIYREAAAGRLRHFREGRFCKVMKHDLEAWREGQYERSADKRAARVTHRDQQGKVSPVQDKRKKADSYKPQADNDILSKLGLPTE